MSDDNPTNPPPLEVVNGTGDSRPLTRALGRLLLALPEQELAAKEQEV
jgi:hypothetical protein